MNSPSATSNGSAALVAGANVGDAPTSNDKVEKKTTITDNERETLTKAFTMIYGVVKSGMGKDPIPSDYTVDLGTLGTLLGCAHRVWKEDADHRAAAVRAEIKGKVDAYLAPFVAKRRKALDTYNRLDADTKGELPAPSTVISIFVSDIFDSGAFGKGYNLQSAVKMLHDMSQTWGYMVHVAKIDGRKKEQDTTPPYITFDVSKFKG